jgi:hypothetical protein
VADELETREAEAGMRNGRGEADLGALYLSRLPVRFFLVSSQVKSIYRNNRQPYGSLSNVLRKSQQGRTGVYGDGGGGSI